MIDRQLLRILRDSIDKAIVDLGEEHGVILETGNATFSDNNFTLKIEGSQMVGGNVMTKEATAYRMNRMHEQTGLELFEEFKQAPRRSRDWKKELDADARENERTFGRR